MAKYHISINGTPQLCKANIQQCPRGGVAQHWGTLAEAQKHADELMLSKFVSTEVLKPDVSMVNEKIIGDKTLLQETYHDKSDDWHDHEHATEVIQNALKQAGFNHRAGLLGETFAAQLYSEDMGLENVLIVDSKGNLKENLSSNEGYIVPDDYKKKESFENDINEELSKHGFSDSKVLIKSIHYSGDKAVIQMGAPNMPDLAIIDGHKVEFVEVKDLHKSSGSQIDSVTSSVNDDGTASMDMSNLPNKVQENLKYIGFSKTIGENHTLNSLTYGDSLQYFIENQQSQGVKHFAYIGRDNYLHDVDFSGNKEDIANKLQDDGITSTLLVRSNEIANKPDEQVIKHWQNQRTQTYFKDGKWPEEKNVKLNKFKFSKGQLQVFQGHLSIGEMVLPVKINNLSQIGKLDMNQDIDMSKIKSRKMTFTGSLKQIK